MFIIKDTLKCLYWHLVASSSYRISLMRSHGLFKKQTNVLFPSLVSVHTYKVYAQISLYESTEKKNLIRNHFQKGHKFFEPKLVTAPSRAEQALWLLGSGVFILQEDRKGE